MSRRIVSSREQDAMRAPWRKPAVIFAELLASVSSMPHDFAEIPDDKGRYRYEYDAEGSTDTRKKWRMIPSDAPATQTGMFYERPRSIHYDPARTEITQDDFNFRPTARGMQFVDPSTDSHRNELIDYLDTPPGMLWRGMSHEEYEEAKTRGYFESKGDHNIGDQQVGKTFFSTQPSSAGSYANGFAPWQYRPTFTRPAYVVGIPDRPDLPRGPLGDDPRSHEVGIPGRIPFSEVKHTYVGRPHSVDEGQLELFKEPWEDKWSRPSVSAPSSMVRWEPLEQQVTAAISLAATLDSVNPTGSMFVDYDPQSRMGLLGPNMTTLDVVHGSTPDEPVTIYRGAPQEQGQISPGDFITTDRQLAEMYGPRVLQMQVPKSHVATSPDEWEGGEHIYSPPSLRQAAIFPPHDEGRAPPPPESAHGLRPPPSAPQGPWYHVSPNPLQPGEKLRPFGGPRQYGEHYDGFGQFKHRDQHVWMEHNPERSAEWAHPERRPYIYEIEPDETPQPWNGSGSEGWVADGATVRRQISDNGWLPMDFTAALTDPRYVDPTYFTGIHEMGHGLDFAGDFETMGKVYDTVKSVWQKEHPGAQPPWGPGDPRMMQWLRGQLPKAAFDQRDWAQGKYMLNDPEALAHAFTEVRLNPQANGVSQALHQLLVDGQVDNDRHGPLSVGPGVPQGFLDAIGDVQADHPAADVNRVDLTPPGHDGPAWMEGPGPYTRPPESDQPPRLRIDQQYANPAEPAKLGDWMDERVDLGHYPRWESTTAAEPWPEDQIADFSDEFAGDHKAANRDVAAADGSGIWRVGRDRVEFIAAPHARPL